MIDAPAFSFVVVSTWNLLKQIKRRQTDTTSSDGQVLVVPCPPPPPPPLSCI
ncbi:hypothetical protein OK016_22865 [Vibrio chagasii]|nr:hypothetical protein [Vibrio chagasii]